MANITRTTADSSGFIPVIWAQRALDVLRSNIVLASLVTRDVDFEPAPKGKALTIPYPGTFTASKKTSGTATVSVPSGGASVTVTLSEHSYVDFIVEDFARAQASAELLDRFVQPAVIALAEQLETDLFSLYSSMTGGSVGTAGTDLTKTVITAAGKKLNDAKAPQSGRSLVFSTKDHAALINDSTLATYFAFSQQQAIREGSLGRIDGFDLYMSQLVPVVAGTPNTTECLAIHKDAIILAMRPLDEPEMDSGVQATVVVDQASGLAIRVLKQYDMANRGHRVGFDILYGYTALRPTLGVNVLS